MGPSILVYIPTLGNEENIDSCEKLFIIDQSDSSDESRSHNQFLSYNRSSGRSESVERSELAANKGFPEVRIIIGHHDSIDEHSKEGNNDWLFLQAALKYCRRNEYLILCKNTSTSNASSLTIMKMIKEIINNFDNNPWDIVYLCKWLDRCDMYSDRHDFSDSNSKLVRTYSPYGTQCLLISPEGQDKLLELYPSLKSKKKDNTSIEEDSDIHIEHVDATLGIALNQAINDGKLVAMTVSPNLINFDPTKASKSVDYRKTIECRDPPKIYCPDKYTKNNTAFFWFIIIVLIVFLLVCILSYSVNYGLPSIEEYNLRRKNIETTTEFTLETPKNIALSSSISPPIV